MTNEIKFDSRNYRKHNAENKRLIKKSLQECGAGRSILIDKNNEIIAGNGVYEQAKKLKMPVRIIETDGSEIVAIKRTDLKTTDEKRKQLAVMDNSTSDSSEFDLELMAQDFNVDALEDMGVNLPDNLMPEEPEVVEDEIPDQCETRCKPGDIWQLGKHRLMCGDSTSKENVEKLMNGKKADISFQSPPYNVGHNLGYENKKSKYIDDDDNSKDYLNFLLGFTNQSIENSKFTFVNVQQLSNNKIDLIDYLHEMKNLLCDTIIWDKGNAAPAMAHRVLNSVFEFIYIFGKSSNRAIGVKDFHGTLNNIIRVGHQSNNEYSKIHNATFPIQLPVEIIQNFTNKGNLIADFFGGTGTTLIACEQLCRICYMMELDPKYCDVILQRYENFTGNKPVLLERKE